MTKEKPKKSRGLWNRKPQTQVKSSAKGYRRDWDMKDFVESVDEVMQEQEKTSPSVKHTHARLSPEWKQMSEKIAQLLVLKNEDEIEKLREEIVNAGEISTRILIDFLLSIKNQTQTP